MSYVRGRAMPESVHAPRTQIAVAICFARPCAAPCWLLFDVACASFAEADFTSPVASDVCASRTSASHAGSAPGRGAGGGVGVSVVVIAAVPVAVAVPVAPSAAAVSTTTPLRSGGADVSTTTSVTTTAITSSVITTISRWRRRALANGFFAISES